MVSKGVRSWPLYWLALLCFAASYNQQQDSINPQDVDYAVTDEWLRRFEKTERLSKEAYLRFLADPTPGAVFYYLANDTAFVEFAAGYELLRKRLQEGGERFRLGYLSMAEEYRLKEPKDVVPEDLPGLTIYHNCVPFTVQIDLEPSNLGFLPRYVAEIRSTEVQLINQTNKYKLKSSNKDYKVIYFSRSQEHYSVMSTLQYKTRDFASIFVVQDETLVQEFLQSKNVIISKVGSFLLACYRETDNQVVYFDQEATIYNIVRFVLNNQFPVWPLFNEGLWTWAQDHNVNLLLIFYYEKEVLKYREKLQPFQSEMQSRRVVPVNAYLSNEYSRKFVQEAGLLRHLPSMVMFKPYVPGLPKYLFQPQDQLSKQAPLEFIRRCANDSLRPFMKSDIPTKRTIGPIRIVVSDDFEARILNPQKRYHSLVFFVDKEIQPIISKFKEVVMQIKPAVPHLRYFIFNCSSNEHPFVTSDYKRSIVLVPHGTRKYGGNIEPTILNPDAALTMKSLLEFIFDHLAGLDNSIKSYFDNNLFD